MRLCLVLILFSLASASVPEPLGINAHQKSVLQHTVQALLDFKQLPNAAKATRPLSKTSNAASKYMRGLFNEYQYKNGGGRGNVVRSVNADLDWFNGRQVLSFRLDGVKPGESLMGAELHYNLRNKRGPVAKKRAYRRIECRALGVRGQTLRMADTDASWLSWDSSEAVQSRLGNGTQPKLMIEFARNLRKSVDVKTLEAARVLRRNTPFLLIYSDGDGLLSKELANENIINEGVNDSQLETNRVKRSADRYYTYSHVTRPRPTDQSAIDTKLKALLSQGPEMLQTRKEMRKRKKTRNRNRKGELFYTDGKVPFGSQSTYYTDQPEDPSEPTVVLLTGEKAETQSYCQKKELLVDFKDIGWDGWIIAPRSFGAHYCQGKCEFPLDTKMNPTNHALMQSIIHVIGLNAFVPAVCCAPEKMDSLTLLYFDENDNVVLKNYPKMIVSSCGCL